MKKSQDIRARALSDQLREIDERYEGVEAWSSSWRMRAGQVVSSLVVLVLVAQWGKDLIGPGIAFVLLYFSIDPLGRLYLRRKAEKERARVIRLFEEIDERVAVAGEKEPEGDP